MFGKGPRPERGRKCKRWLIDQHILQDLLKQSVPTTLSHHSTESLVRDVSEDSFDEMSPVSLDVLGEELLQKLTGPADSQDISSKSSDTGSDFKDSDEDDFNEEQVQRTPKDPPSKALNMPMLDLL